MNSNLCEVVCILDRSGSMSSIINDAIGGLNTFLADCRTAPEQRKATIVMFDNQYEVPYECVDAKDIPDFTIRTYSPRGGTALYDAIGRTIDTVGARLARTPENDRPMSVVVAIVTDGEENASHEYTQQRIKEMIDHQSQKYAWTFVFLAANQDACLTAQSMGISVGNSLNFASTGTSTRSCYSVLSKSVSYTNDIKCMNGVDAYVSDAIFACNNGSNSVKED